MLINTTLGRSYSGLGTSLLLGLGGGGLQEASSQFGDLGWGALQAMSPSIFNSLGPEPTGPSGRQVEQGHQVEWSSIKRVRPLGTASWIHQLSKRILLQGAGLSLLPALERGVLASLWLDPQKMDLGSDPPRADSYT